MKTLIAVDPGALGAIAVRDADGRVYVERMPVIRDLMQRRFPELRVTQVTADALGLLCFLQAQGEVK